MFFNNAVGIAITALLAGVRLGLSRIELVHQTTAIRPTNGPPFSMNVLKQIRSPDGRVQGSTTKLTGIKQIMLGSNW